MVDAVLLDISECTNNYSEYRDVLVTVTSKVGVYRISVYNSKA